MFEAHVLHLLRKYLGEYVHGLSIDALRISVWKGDVVLRDLKLKAEALNSLNLPVTVKSGFVGTITLKVPWKSLGKEPVIVLIDRVFVLAHPAPDGQRLEEEDREKLLEAKLQHIEEAESATLEAISRSKLGNQPSGNSWLGSLISTIIGNLKISISNVHIRYEDSLSNSGHPFSMGVTLAKLAAVTMDEEGNETFNTSGALDNLRKSLQLERLAMYHDTDTLPWKIDKRWEDLIPTEWIEIFEDGINEPPADCGTPSLWAVNRSYIVSPINGVLKYHRLGKQERNDPEIPFEKASLVLSDVSLTITEAQYHDWIKLFEVISRYKTYIEVAHLRPVVPASENPSLWWRYAAQAGLQQKKFCYRFSWERIRHLCQLRRRYVQLYASSLQHLPSTDIKEIRNIEKDLDSKVILLWRLLAHAKVESVKSKEAAEQKRFKRSWFSLGWNAPAEDSSTEGPQSTEGRLTNEEWEAINKLLSYQPDDELTAHQGKDVQKMIHYLVTVSIGQAAARIINRCQNEVLCGRFEQLDVSTKIKHRSTLCDVVLRYYGLSAPEGAIAQSVCSGQKENALTASFVHSPVGENVDWKLSATISPCHVTILVESYGRFLEFVKRSSALSPTVAFETATALQMKIEKVTRRAQEQIQMVLEEQSRFALDIDFDAPKVRIPIRTSSSSTCDSHFLLDFGHFTLHTRDGQYEGKREKLYSQFYISGRDIAAFFTDCRSESQSCTLVVPNHDREQTSPVPEECDSLYSLLDPCGMSVLVDQINVPHPSYPSTRISVQVPVLGIHFSPGRYRRLMELSNIIYGALDINGQQTSENFQADLAPWSPVDLAMDARILVWRGIGNSVATWQPCFLVLSGPYLYLLESENSKNYQRYLSMSGRQVYDVPSTSIGGSPLCLAVSHRGMDIQKALESSSTWILEFRDEEDKSTWLKGLIQATYQASAPLSVDVFGEKDGGITDSYDSQSINMNAADLVLTGALLETKLFIYGMSDYKVDEGESETLIVEVLAGGGKVHLVRSEGDLKVKMKLHSLKIKDELQGHLSSNPQYVACSVVKNGDLSCPHVSSPTEKDMTAVLQEDDDIFKDALQDFMSLSESPCPSNMDIFHSGMMEDVDHASPKFAESFIHGKDVEKEKSVQSELYYEAQGSDTSDFVSVTFLTKSSGSPDYDGVDTQLEFFCNRPTLVALIDFGFSLSSVDSAASFVDPEKAIDEESQTKKDETGESGRVQGLLGYGKSRVVFNLNMNVDSVTVFLNKEDGSQLAMLVQESFLLDLKVHPSSLSIEGTLGNFRLRDMSLGMDNCWNWLCDLRNPGFDSLIKFKFHSYSSEDDDYKGYDYSLSGRLSAVRIVFLNRFVREISSYFMELATPHTEEAIKLVDKVGGFEWFIQKYEIDGATALKLDLSFDTPIIIVPRNSISTDFIQLDLGKLQVTNEFTWHGFPEKDPSAVHVDVLHAEILGINMSVGIDGSIGEPMIRKGQGFDVYVRRSLRDVFKKVPSLSLEVKIGSLHGVMSDKEYGVILDCLYLNLNEEPRLPPSFRDSCRGSRDTMRLLADKVNLNSQLLLSRTVTIVAVEVNYALLELCHGTHEDSAIAHIILEGLWVSYRMTSLSEADLYVTIPKFSILDIRPDTKAEMRLMLGSSADAFKQISSAKFPFSSSRKRVNWTNSEAEFDINVPISTMFLMDYRWRISSQSFVIRVQQPRVLFVPDFIITVAEFFVPALKSVTGREEKMDPINDPISRNSCIVLSEPIYKQKENHIILSPDRQLVADAPGVDEYIYDGCGKTICLNEETNMKDFYSARFRPIVIVGRGKRLRFINVNIENGSLLRKYTYLSSNSSYSVSPEDGVDIVLLDKTSNEKSAVDIQDSFGTLSNPKSEIKTNGSPSFTFEAQVVSPEFTFYDGTKSFDDASYGEKLLRAKMDLSFMFASKDNDTWIRALLKDLTVEAGSGLTILDPVDISGGYTSVKEKTNISLVSTDIYVHLSLSAISLILNLQNQATEALQFGNAVPLVMCTNFDRIWSSPKENGPYKKLTFWRPRAPTNYVILGDCVTSRPIPPSQAVMSVNNTYGRVRKPMGFTLIATFSASEEYMEEDSPDASTGCSLWMPIAPPGYVAAGCVAQIGNKPPLNHTVYCIRSDLVTSTKYSECIFSISSGSAFPSGFSVWRLDNVLGSYFAHPLIEQPPKESCFDLSHLLLWSSHQYYSSSRESGSGSKIHDEDGRQQSSSQIENISDSDVTRSISKATNYLLSTPNFERLWWDKGGELRRPVSIWRPIARPGYGILGDCIIEGLEPPALGMIFRADNPEISAKPVQFTKVARIGGRGFDEVFFWYPVAPPGYASLGCVVSRTDEAPSVNLFCCPRMDLVGQANIIEVPISRSASLKQANTWSIWKVENQACTFLARSDLKKPSSRLAFTIGDAVKPKARENITAEMKLRRLSLTVIDSLGGMMTPLVDTTITNIKLATHGRLDSLNAVLVSSIAASTFNTQLEAWEPLLEPFDGIFKFEIYDTNLHPPSQLGKRVRVAATSILNINVSSANLENLVQAVVSWRRQSELEQKTAKMREETDNCNERENQEFCALDEHDLQTVIVENKLGCDLYLKKVEDNVDAINLLRHDDCSSIWVPPPRFSDRLNLAADCREVRNYVAVHILEAKGLPVLDDGNSHNFFCALRLVVDSKATDQHKLFPQSARTKCVKPTISKINDQFEGSAKWNELFIFEVPRKGLAKLEVEVTNLAAKAGKGEVVGALSFSVGNGANMLRKIASARMLHQSSDVQNFVSYSLKGKEHLKDSTELHDKGCLSLSTSLFERKTSTNIQEDKEMENDLDREIGFWVGIHPEGSWQSIRSLLPVSVVPKNLNDDFIAMEVFMQNGRKHVIFRGLATVINDSDIQLDISICHVSASHGCDPCSAISPGSSTILPWTCTSKNSGVCLQVRPQASHPEPSFSWGCLVAADSGFPSSKDDPFMESGSLSRQSTSKQGHKLPNFSFMLDQLEKKDVLLCSTGAANKKLWLTVGADASVLHTEMNSPVYDWKISINSPLKMENRLPCPMRFTLWENLKEGKAVERQQGLIFSRKSVHVYSIDIQRPLYISLFAQGGWVLEKDPVLLLDLSSSNNISSFWLVHSRYRRRLRVSIERDMGGTAAAPKTIRLFVPYWIINESSLPLTYRAVETDNMDCAETDSLSISRAVKSARRSFRNPSFSMERRESGSKKDIQVLEAIEDTSPIPQMFSPQDYTSRSGVSLFQSQKGPYPSPRVGIAVAMRDSENYSPGISLPELEKKQRVDVNAFSSDGSYYKLSAILNVTSDRTKVIHFQPHTLFVNRLGCSLCIQQCETTSEVWIHPSDSPKPFGWKSSSKVELLKSRIDGYRWSTPFSVSAEGVMRISLQRDMGSDRRQLRVEVRSGSKSSHYEVIFRPDTTSSPYRIENRSMFLPIRFRQVDGTADSWNFLLPNAAASFLWEDLGRWRLLELLVDGTDPLKSQSYNIDEISDHLPLQVSEGPVRALRVTIVKEEKMNVVRISDWMPENEFSATMSGRMPSSLSLTSASDSDQQPSDCEFHVILELAELGISIIDHTPEEILYLSVQSLLLAYSTGLGSGISRFKLRMHGIQLDNQLPLTPTPVLFRPQRLKEDADFILKLSLTKQSYGSLELSVYPYVGFQGPENSAFLISIHEPIIWRLHDMIKQINLGQIYDSQTTAVSVDPIIQIGVLNISEIRLKVSVAMSPSQRPRGVLGFWLSLMTALGNTENMPVRINQKFKENVCMRQSAMISNAILNIKKDLLSQPLQLLSGVDILGNASSALGHMSKGVAALSMDRKFIQSRQRQDNKGVEDFGDVIREGGGAFAKGLFRGVTGILTKPLEGAKTSGVEGFVQGVGKGIIGAAAQPVSGVLDLLSKTTEGANAMRMKIAAAITSDEQLLRRRLPRVISGDNLLRPYDEYRAQGQVILQLAESGSFFGQVDLFKVRGKFALSDAYEDHFLLPKANILVITHRRVILLQQPTQIIAQRKFSPAKDPCSVLWDVLWDGLVTMELQHGKKDHPAAPPSRVLLYLQTRSVDLKDQIRVVKCSSGSTQAFDVYSSIERAMNIYGPSSLKEMLKRRVTKPYSPVMERNFTEVISKEGTSIWAPQHVPLSSTFGSSTN